MSMDPRAKAQVVQRVERIQSRIDIIDVLAHYGYRVQVGGGDREQQFPCDLHGDGQDNTPSARAYGDSFYCWACGKKRDAVDLVQIKEHVSFAQACRVLEQRYNLPALPFVDYQYEPVPDLRKEVHDNLTREVSFEQWAARLDGLLLPLTHDRVLSMEQTLGFWESLDKVRRLVFREELTERKGCAALDLLRTRILEALHVDEDQHELPDRAGDRAADPAGQHPD